VTQSKWDPVPREYIPSTIQPINPSSAWLAPLIVATAWLGTSAISFVGGLMVGRGL
jgi:hypothetical protein